MNYIDSCDLTLLKITFLSLLSYSTFAILKFLQKYFLSLHNLDNSFDVGAPPKTPYEV